MDASARRRLVAWYRRHRRDLPWRRTRDPYAILVSEFMLQQTRTETVVPYFTRWLRRFPDVASLARADEEDVLAAWSGLGYYRRARSLHGVARAAAAGGLPTTAGGLAGLPGIGPYTAAAVASIAFGEPVACIDGNVARVVARIAGIRGAAGRTAGPTGRRRVARLAQAWMDARAPGEWNQAMMELGATVCTPRAPACGACPVADACRAKAGGLQESIPARRPRARPPVERVRLAVVRRGDAVLLVRPKRGLLAGLWALPGGPGSGLARMVRLQTGIEVEVAPGAVGLRHAFSHRSWNMEVAAATACDGARPRGGARWVARAELPGLAMSTAMRKALRAAGIEA